MLQTKFMLIKSDQTKPQSPTRRVTYVVGHDSRYIIKAFLFFVTTFRGLCKVRPPDNVGPGPSPGIPLLNVLSVLLISLSKLPAGPVTGPRVGQDSSTWVNILQFFLHCLYQPTNIALLQPPTTTSHVWIEYISIYVG